MHTPDIRVKLKRFRYRDSDAMMLATFEVQTDNGPVTVEQELTKGDGTCRDCDVESHMLVSEKFNYIDMNQTI